MSTCLQVLAPVPLFSTAAHVGAVWPQPGLQKMGSDRLGEQNLWKHYQQVNTVPSCKEQHCLWALPDTQAYTCQPHNDIQGHSHNPRDKE